MPNKESYLSPREMFSREMTDSMTDRELFYALMSYCAHPEKANTMAEMLDIKFGSLRSAIDADPKRTESCCGLNERAAVLIRLIGDLKSQLRAEKDTNIDIATPEAVKKFFVSSFGRYDTELLAAAAADFGLKAVNCGILAMGSRTSVSVNMSAIAGFAYYNSADRIFLAHTHPHGSAEPSDGDIASTKAAVEAFAPLGITIVDHIIVAPDEQVSMYEWGKSHNKYTGLGNVPGYGKAGKNKK